MAEDKIVRKEDVRQIPRWMWLLQIVLFRTLGCFIAINETVISSSSKFQWESLVFAAWLFLFPEVVRGRGFDIFSRLTGSSQPTGGDKQ
jgi:hypothetical protein